MGEYTNFSQGIHPPRSVNWVAIVVGFAFVALVAFLTYGILEEPELVAEVEKKWMSYFKGESSLKKSVEVDEDISIATPVASVAQPPEKQIEEAVQSKVVAHEPTKQELDVKINPYWHLPNPIFKNETANQSLLSLENEAALLASLRSGKPYERYQAIEAVRQVGTVATQGILWQGLKDEKFWVRMSALMGLVELGIPVSKDIMEEILAETRPDLVRNYLQRFSRNPTRAELYIMREMLKISDEGSRLALLKNLVKVPGGLREIYLAAATHDPSLKIVRFAQAKFSSLQISAMNRKLANEVVLGRKTYSEGSWLASESHLAKERAPDSQKISKEKSRVLFYDQISPEKSDEANDGFFDLNVKVRKVGL